MARRPRNLALALAVGVLGVAGVWRLRGASSEAAPSAPVATLRSLAVLSPQSPRCDPAVGKPLVCSASGVRVHDGQLWLVLDGAGALVARASLPAGHGGALELGGPYAFDVEAVASPSDSCEPLHDLEALAFASDGRLVVTTDRWQVAWLDTAASLKVTACRQYEPRLPPNHGFEAVVVAGDTVHAISENPVSGAFQVYSEAPGRARTTAGFAWERSECASGSPRIADAVALGDGALLLGSCRARVGGYDYLLAKVAPLPGAAPRIVHETRIDNPGQQNLEGLERLTDGRLIVVNDDSRGDERETSTGLWELVVPAAERRALGL